LFAFSSIEQYHAQLKEGTLTCVQAVNYYLKQIKELSRLNAFIEVFADEALEKAKQLDKERQSGKQPGRLHGVIVGIKDVICYKGHKVSAASNILKGFTSVYSATAIERLLVEEAIIIVLPEAQQ
jgi:aspartyl-tRNA(Asn)/glutamyl-tRNA(Gln) amidotransferase subunit A